MKRKQNVPAFSFEVAVNGKCSQRLMAASGMMHNTLIF